MIVLRAPGFVIERQFGMVANGEMRDEVLPEFLLLDGQESGCNLIKSQNSSLLASKRST